MDYFTTEGKFSASLHLRSRPPVSDHVEQESRICVRVWKDRGSEKDRTHKVNMHREPVKTACHRITACIKQALIHYTESPPPVLQTGMACKFSLIFDYDQVYVQSTFDRYVAHNPAHGRH